MKSGAYLIIEEKNQAINICKKIITQLIPQSYAGKDNSACIIYCSPSKGMYKKNDIEEYIKLLKLEHSHDCPLCLIITDAHKLSDIISNSLLKILEELPNYCYVFFITPSQSLILPTIASRCIIQTNRENSNLDPLQIIAIILDNKTEPLYFEELIIKSSLDESSSQLLLTNLSAHILDTYKKKDELVKKLIHLNRYSIKTSNPIILWRAIFALIKSELNSP